MSNRSALLLRACMCIEIVHARASNSFHQSITLSCMVSRTRSQDVHNGVASYASSWHASPESGQPSAHVASCCDMHHLTACASTSLYCLQGLDKTVIWQSPNRLGLEAHHSGQIPNDVAQCLRSSGCGVICADSCSGVCWPGSNVSSVNRFKSATDSTSFDGCQAPPVLSHISGCG